MKKYPCVHDLYVPNYARKANMNTKKRHVGELQTADCLKTTFSLHPDFVESIFFMDPEDRIVRQQVINLQMVLSPTIVLSDDTSISHQVSDFRTLQMEFLCLNYT